MREEEEACDRLEPLLATAVSRRRWVTGHPRCAGLGATALLLAFAAAMALTAGPALGGTARLVRELTGAALAQLPAAPSSWPR